MNLLVEYLFKVLIHFLLYMTHSMDEKVQAWYCKSVDFIYKHKYNYVKFSINNKNSRYAPQDVCTRWNIVKSQAVCVRILILSISTAIVNNWYQFKLNTSVKFEVGKFNETRNFGLWQRIVDIRFSKGVERNKTYWHGWLELGEVKGEDCDDHTVVFDRQGSLSLHGPNIFEGGMDSICPSYEK